ncbi:MAG: DNA repair protein RecN [Eubacterium sp.]|nr:DNA repair protein RecN [Eubacterium sp.]
MLQNLHIKNLALIDELDIELGEGLNILSGETGAGKSIIVGSIGIGLGGRFGKDLLRDPEKDGLVELIFTVDSEAVREKLSAIEIETPDDMVIISRRVSGTRTVNRINDATVSVGKLRETAEILINLHAQHEQTTLLKESRHLEIIDSSDDRIEEVKKTVAETYHEYKDVCDRLISLNMDEGERRKRQDFLQYQIEEIEKAGLKEGEDTELEELYSRISASHDITEIAEDVHSVTGYDNVSSAGSMFSRACQRIRELEKYDNGETAASLINSLSDIDSLLNDFNNDIAEYMKNMEFDPELLRETESRLDLINTLKSKFGKTVPDIMETLNSLKQEYEELEGFNETLAELTEKEKVLLKRLKAESDKLTEIRKDAAEKLTAKIKEALLGLNFSEVIFYAAFSETENYTANGHDSVSFMISTNVGEKERPLAEVASGGELSRVMLAIKSTLADKDETPTLVFDEIDVGISGITAQKVADMMKLLAKTHQIITITHLPQIAASSDIHFLIEKTVEDGKTHTGIRRLDEEEIIYEIARILGGEKITESVLSSARELRTAGPVN